MTHDIMEAFLSKCNYGLVMSEDDLIDVFNIQRPDISSRNSKDIISNVKKFELAKLGVYSRINELLLSQGMCFIQDKDNYRIPLLSEMNAYISRYYASAKRKFNRGEKLRKSFTAIHPSNDVISKEVVKSHIAMCGMSRMYQPMKEK